MSPLFLTGFALLVLNTVVGMVANGFIVLVICIDWFRSRKLSPTDLILCCLGLSRFFWQMVVILNVVMDSFFMSTYLQNNIVISFATMWLFLKNLSLWFAAWLSVLYFVKVSIFSYPVFLQMKQRFSGMVPWLLLGTVVFSFAVTVIFSAASKNVICFCLLYPSPSSNSSDSAIQTLNFCRYLIILVIAPNIIPFMLFFSSSIFLMRSLWKHTRCLQTNGTGLQDLSTEAHLTAIKALASFAVLYLSSFAAVILEMVLKSKLHWTYIVFENVSAIYPSGHAIILILINPKLKQAWGKMLHHFRCHLIEAPS